MKSWLETATLSDFLARINADAGLLTYRASTSDGYSLLHDAAALGRNDLLASILARGIDVDLPSGRAEIDSEHVGAERFEPGYTPLMSAARNGLLSTVRLLLLAGADPGKTDYYGGTAVHSAAVVGAVGILNVLLAAGVDPGADCGLKMCREELGFYWVVPLHVAAVSEQVGSSRVLLGHGAEVDAEASDGRRPLHYAAACGAVGVLKNLLQAGSDPNKAEAFHGQAPLHVAIRSGHVGCVAALLRHGADAALPEGRDASARSSWRACFIRATVVRRCVSYSGG